MIKITGGTCSDLCDPHLKMTRRDLLRVGGAGILGLSLGSLLKLQALAGETGKRAGGPGWGTAKNVVMIYLQGGPSHLDLWDPKENLPDNIRSAFNPIPTKIPGVNFTEMLPELAKLNDIKLPPEVFALRHQRRANLRDSIEQAMPDVEKAVEKYNLDDYYQRALNLIISGRARNAFDLAQEPDKLRDRYGRNTFGQSCLMARRLIEAGTRVVEVIWPKVANSDNHSWDHHVDLTKRIRDQSGPMLDRGLASFIADIDD